jgi:hypothetical protein
MSEVFMNCPTRFLNVLAVATAFSTLAAAPCHANLITNGNFSSAGISSMTFEVNNPATYNRWLDVVQWQVDATTTPGNPFAWHNTTTNAAPSHNGNHTNLLFQGFSAAGLTAGTQLAIDLDYQFANGGSLREVRLYGFGPGGSLSPFAPWTPINGSVLGTWNLATTSGWTHFSTLFSLPSTYSALVLGVVMNSGETLPQQQGLRAVDNLSVRAVPEPASLVLLGVGLAAAVAARRRAT